MKRALGFWRTAGIASRLAVGGMLASIVAASAGAAGLIWAGGAPAPPNAGVALLAAFGVAIPAVVLLGVAVLIVLGLGSEARPLRMIAIVLSALVGVVTAVQTPIAILGGGGGAMPGWAWPVAAVTVVGGILFVAAAIAGWAGERRGPTLEAD